MKKLCVIFTVAAIMSFSITMSAQSGGAFTIEKSVIAAGGGESTGGGYTVNGTIGEAAAGTTSSGGNFQVTGGFWGGGSSAPVSQFVTVSGQVFTSGGAGLRNARVTMTDGALINRSVLTSSLGFFSFDSVETGRTYTITVGSKRFRFQAQNFMLNGALTNLVFTGLE